MKQNTKVKLSRYQLGMAGEYSVCAELLKRGFNVSITMGNAKATDVLVFQEDETYKRIEVKTSRSTRFVTGFFQKYYDRLQSHHPDFWVLCHIDADYVSHYYILTHEEMGHVQMERNKMDGWKKVEKGCDNVLLKHVEQYENQWDKILNK